MKVLVCGGRHFADREMLFQTLDNLHGTTPVTLVIHGAARGADFLADEWAKARGVPVKAYPADWNKHGLAAGPIRNREMLKETPALVVAMPGGRGTSNMTMQARAQGVPVLEVGQ